jgi:hypothetical protein
MHRPDSEQTPNGDKRLRLLLNLLRVLESSLDLGHGRRFGLVAAGCR